MTLPLDALLTIPSCLPPAWTGSQIQYLLISAVFTSVALVLTRPLRPTQRMAALEKMAAEAQDEFDAARESRTFQDRRFKAELQMRLAEAQEARMSVRTRLRKEYGLGPSKREFLHVFGLLATDIAQCKKEFQAIYLAIVVRTRLTNSIPSGAVNGLQDATEDRKREVYTEEVEEMRVVLASGARCNGET
ncbi:hypothetical protein MKEN_01269300 [Mycena kentingensis (nom. inval.)]|nr:hypothetical protein MKEN_01269300 [Mycena kentingensis (nom. inval.)]